METKKDNSDDSVIVKDELQLIRDFLRDSVGYYIREKITGLDAGLSNEDINKDLEKTLSVLLDGMAKPAQFFDKDGKPLEGIVMRERQAEIEKAAEALKQDLPKYIQFMDIDILEQAKKKMPEEYYAEELIPKMQKVASKSVISETSEVLSSVLKKEKKENSTKLIDQVSLFFNEIHVPALGTAIKNGYSSIRDSYVKNKRSNRVKRAEALHEALGNASSLINFEYITMNKKRAGKTGHQI